jgi:hypothetical protein
MLFTNPDVLAELLQHAASGERVIIEFQTVGDGPDAEVTAQDITQHVEVLESS